MALTAQVFELGVPELRTDRGQDPRRCSAEAAAGCGWCKIILIPQRSNRLVAVVLRAPGVKWTSVAANVEVPVAAAIASTTRRR